MAWNRDLLMNDPQYWGTTLPDSNDFNGDLQAYLDAVKAAHDASPANSGLAYAAPSIFTGPDGQQWSAAGYTQDRTPGEQAAAVYNWHLNNQALHPGVHGPAANGSLALESRMALHPEEAQLAYDAYEIDPDTGLPVAVLNDAIINLMERQGIRPTPALDKGDTGTVHTQRGNQRPHHHGSVHEQPGIQRPHAHDGTPADRVGPQAGPYVPMPDVGPPSNLSTIHPDYPDFIIKYVQQRQGGPVAPQLKGY